MELRLSGNQQLVQHINKNNDRWMVLWDTHIEKNTQTGEQDITHMTKVFNHKPSIEEIKETIFNWYNENSKEKILSGFVWKDMLVWLSYENQLNYKMAYDLVISSNGAFLPTFKFGTTFNPIYYEFKSVEEFEDFYQKMFMHINTTLEEGWILKESIDWESYEKLLNDG